MSRPRIRLGTRDSLLARAQAAIVAHALAGIGADVEIVPLTTSGDLRAPDTAWGEGAFVDALEVALRDDRIDAAIHSAKDMPTDHAAVSDLTVAAYVTRADARDAIVVRAGGLPTSMETIPNAAIIGTDSPRRSGFLLSLRPDLRIRPLSGNVDTRLRRLDDGDVDALVLAVAGLERLGRGDRVGLALDPSLMPPAPGQGALAVQVRVSDDATLDTVARLDDEAVRATVEAERAVLRTLGGGCQAPIGALATLDRERLTLVAGRVEPDGSDRRVGAWSGPPGAGLRLAAEVAAALS